MTGLQQKNFLLNLDDIIVIAKDFAERLERLDEVFSGLKKAVLRLKAQMYELFQKQVQFLGHVLSATGLSHKPEKVNAIQNWSTSTNLTKVRSFLDLCSYYRC